MNLSKVHYQSGPEASMSGRTKAAVELNQLQFTWPKRKVPTLAIESFSVVKGERLFIAGPSGSGKSSLLGILAGVINPQEGTVQALGVDLNSMNSAKRDRFRADHIGYIFQMFNLIPYLSVVENVTLPCRFSKFRRDKVGSRNNSVEAEAFRLLEQLGLQGKDFTSTPVVELSVGQQQRVAAARALIGSPEIIIADEPTSALDSDHRENFLQLLFQEGKQTETTIIFVSHDTSLASYFDRTTRITDINKVTSLNNSATAS